MLSPIFSLCTNRQSAVKWFKHLPPPAAAKVDTKKQEQEMKRKAGKRNTVVIMPYKAEQKLLLVGEGNFSFSAALADKLGSAVDIMVRPGTVCECAGAYVPVFACCVLRRCYN
jgi:hypothetical protein